MLQTRPPRKCLVCDFCPSVRDFASGFLQIPPRDGHPCLWLTVPTAKSVADFHRQVIAHAGLTTNEGLHAAWNTGLCVATGEYLCFVDSDDYVENNMVEVMLSYANTDDADVHVFGYWHDYINTSIKVSLPELIMSEDVKKNIFFQNRINLRAHGQVWSKLYRRSFLINLGLSFCHQQYPFEDSIFLLFALHHANRVRCHTDILYHYRILSTSSIHRFNPLMTDYINTYINRYGYFVDTFFNGHENSLMKQVEAVEGIIRITRLFNHKDSGLSRSKKKEFISNRLRSEPFVSAIREVPIRTLPIRRGWQVLLLRFGLVNVWFSLFCIADSIWSKQIIKRQMYD